MILLSANLLSFAAEERELYNSLDRIMSLINTWSIWAPHSPTCFFKIKFIFWYLKKSQSNIYFIDISLNLISNFESFFKEILESRLPCHVSECWKAKIHNCVTDIRYSIDSFFGIDYAKVNRSINAYCNIVSC